MKYCLQLALSFGFVSMSFGLLASAQSTMVTINVDINGVRVASAPTEVGKDGSTTQYSQSVNGQMLPQEQLQTKVLSENTTEKVTEAFKLMLNNSNVKAILVNIFGGIMKCDVIAEGVVAAAREVKLSVPLVVRLEGTNVELGKKILVDSGLPIISASNMADAAAKVVEAIRK